jgi:hypothetical protein
MSALLLVSVLAVVADLAFSTQAVAQTDPLPSWNDGPAQDVDEQKRQAFAATFASMSAEEADAFQRVIDEACERMD